MIRRCLLRRCSLLRCIGTTAAAVVAQLALTAAPPQQSAAAETRPSPPTAATVGAAARAWTAPVADDRGADDRADGGERRLYVTGMVGSSLTPPAGDAVIGPFGGAATSGEGAIGVAIPQPLGDWRFEVEGRRHAAAAGWATTANAWRGLPLGGRVAAYAGGGMGCGGVADVPGGTRGAGLAWQAGGGLAWAWHDRLTFDVGYRLHGLEAVGGRTSVAPAGEVLFAVRLYEPFRRWRDD